MAWFWIASTLFSRYDLAEAYASQPLIWNNIMRTANREAEAWWALLPTSRHCGIEGAWPLTAALAMCWVAGASSIGQLYAWPLPGMEYELKNTINPFGQECLKTGRVSKDTWKVTNTHRVSWEWRGGLQRRPWHRSEHGPWPACLGKSGRDGTPAAGEVAVKHRVHLLH